MQPIRVIVIDDSAFMRKVISDILESDIRIEVVATARNGEDGLKKIQMFNPDVVTMDVHMPIMDGVTALEKIMSTAPLPVIMLTSSEEEATETIEAISKGAVDFIYKPSGPISLNIDTIREEIISKVVTASSIEISAIEKFSNENPKTYKAYDHTIIGIGSSTGGPRALQKVLSDIPKTFHSPILVVQHMPAGFTKSLADRLNGLCHLHVKEAEDGEIIRSKTVYIAPGNYHMNIEKIGTELKIHLTDKEPRNNHRPSVDVLFESIAEINKMNKIAVVLTGMGNDGSQGIKELKNKDNRASVIVESEETCIVYGMPKAAINTRCVDYIEPLYLISDRIDYLVRQYEKRM
ncbi:chemotaxis response regulator protein-glutamate methylesterase [Oceanobacillus piezotolerans]|uniref:Protein-glutamate methylesterase/protein-glutamine glutaminase n=1 Tax=Oceanobacillus piezotolerans TaxID=2448030 RepID=A0A498DIK9_9BACI|nr:chemotaxis response regulator protein-glutamate methylesterase [Oceanobacillus piezotolerans]RLL45335.1 chemotaxis response regulator protein-glutamate methylesterase [Oceanobacillus piezotolerans]